MADGLEPAMTRPGSLALEMAEQQFAQAMSAKGGLGIAKLVTAGIGARRGYSCQVRLSNLRPGDADDTDLPR